MNRFYYNIVASVKKHKVTGGYFHVNNNGTYMRQHKKANYGATVIYVPMKSSLNL